MKIPRGYRKLRKGTVHVYGDMIWSPWCNEFVPLAEYYEGTKHTAYHVVIRRIQSKKGKK